ncbi:MAG: hypothetical protein CMJ46_07530 [Planctomyces sp.]|nr:hypothetical protein [Planctomyces sp.]
MYSDADSTADDDKYAPLFTADVVPEVRYAGLWPRFVALVIDVTILVLLWPLLRLTLIYSFQWSGLFDDPRILLVSLYITEGATLLLSVWFYFALMERSRDRGTFGKQAVGLCIESTWKYPNGVLRGVARFFFKFCPVTAIPGFVMVLFHPRRRALHDLLSGTVVVRRK